MELKYMANKRSHHIRRDGKRTNYKVNEKRTYTLGPYDNTIA